MITVTLLLADPLVDRISTAYNLCLLHSIGGLCYHSLMQHHNDFIVWREMHKPGMQTDGVMCILLFDCTV
jgi:HD-like signal output (HDOD) protein